MCVCVCMCVFFSIFGFMYLFLCSFMRCKSHDLQLFKIAIVFSMVCVSFWYQRELSLPCSVKALYMFDFDSKHFMCDLIRTLLRYGFLSTVYVKPSVSKASQTDMEILFS
jgi:hypothetical protein